MTREPQELFAGLMRQIMHLQRQVKSEEKDGAYAAFLKSYIGDDNERYHIGATMAAYAQGSSENALALISDETLKVIDAVEEICGAYEEKLGAMNAQLGDTIFALEQQKVPVVHKLTDPRVRKAVFNMTGGKCAYCEREVVDGAGDAPESMCIEHVVPRTSGGPDHINNFVPSCRPCNTAKRDKHVLLHVRRMLRKPELVIDNTIEIKIETDDGVAA